MTQDEQRKHDWQILEKTLSGLREHFDHVHIFASRDAEDGTSTINAQLGSGNWFARYGQIRMWADKQLCYEQKAINEEPPDESP